MPNQPDHWKFFRNDLRSPMALFLDYFLNMKHLGLCNLTVSRANTALSILTCIHEAHILHNDLVPRNILVSHSGQVVIICIAPYFIFHVAWSRFIYDLQVDFSDVDINPANMSTCCGSISCFMNNEYFDTW